ncbi:hypothetical protein G7085_09085 [Tessaracoccus sp. HDW20]|uniref:hypothetical protein n=1 Tax=Tessaracoccus coleopterorum TaxID=2714950 RepID=UPI0018D327B5|nr:hypothetical protein [Tessaracoccus coleopterorum]NHB84713.1 hypothetical protein [Tessaracoccus coleopterorum]
MPGRRPPTRGPGASECPLHQCPQGRQEQARSGPDELLGEEVTDGAALHGKQSLLILGEREAEPALQALGEALEPGSRRLAIGDEVMPVQDRQRVSEPDRLGEAAPHGQVRAEAHEHAERNHEPGHCMLRRKRGVGCGTVRRRSMIRQPR